MDPVVFGKQVDDAPAGAEALLPRAENDAPDPGVNANAARTDDEWRLSLNHAVPLADQWLALFSVEHARNRSNLPNFRYRNTSVSASLMRTF